jgi:hypothetical protein
LLENELPPFSETEWEKMVSRENAKRFYEDTYEMIGIINKGTGSETTYPFEPETASWTASIDE